MNATGGTGLETSPLEYTNCCQPTHCDGFRVPLQAEVVKKFALSWSEKVSGCGGGLPLTFPLSLVTPVTLSKDPTASDMWPVTWAETSLPFPTVSGRGPRAGGYGRAGAVVHGTSCHSGLGYEDVKHPFFGRGTRAMPLRHSCRLFAGGGGVVADGGVGFGVCAWPSGTANNTANAARPSATIACRGPGIHEFVFNG